MAEEKRLIIKYTCEHCKAQFDAPQGSVKRYCPDCLAKAVARELPKKE
jgi:DNA-directed RNA polymerase subunit RPC12/RpoP